MMKKILFLLGTVCFGWLVSCSRYQSYSEVPEIHFKNLVFEDRWDTLSQKFINKPVLTFSFIDGDGDLGVRPQEIKPDGTYFPGGGISRIYYTWFQKNADQTYEPYQFINGATTSSKIPYEDVMDKSEAQNKTLKGIIEIELSKPGNLSGIDTMRIEFYIFDRAGNQSNTEYTPDFSIFSEPGAEITK